MAKTTQKNPTIQSPPASDKLTEDTATQLKMAGQVQRAFLPASLPDSDKLRWAALYQPAEWVSGDIYDAARLDEQHIGFYIADAVGHSMPAALLTMFLKQALVMRRTNGDDYRIFGPQEVIKNLNLKMVEQNLGSSLFATCCYCLLNIRTTIPHPHKEKPTPQTTENPRRALRRLRAVRFRAGNHPTRNGRQALHLFRRLRHPHR